MSIKAQKEENAKRRAEQNQLQDLGEARSPGGGSHARVNEYAEPCESKRE